ncbi:hypothetical protein [Thalassotalea marina]|uniref:Uncharacterized protein n=1 Tax=Thalassotalea marina TaxID=1673741 RepID=A0A919BIS1_9GAMM|nr:hypothetical protein [Thalassotalea marina]GHF92066.1 hypothetical protein GCM10017161_20140 [Thalassotalea marina]
MIELNYLKVGLTIFISIFLSLLSYHFFEKYLLVTKQEKVTPVIYQQPNDFSKTALQIQKQSLEQIKQIRELNKEERNRINSIRRTNDETCQYWRSQYQKNYNDYNRSQMQSACSRAAND